MQVAGSVYDVGKSLKRWIDGEISGTGFVISVAERGMDFVVEGVGKIAEVFGRRLEFERNVAQFLTDRQEVIDRGLRDFETSMQMNDMTGVSAALNEIAREFGGELQFKNRNEFDKLMLDDDSDFVL